MIWFTLDGIPMRDPDAKNALALRFGLVTWRRTMKRSGFSQEKIFGQFKEHQAGVSAERIFAAGSRDEVPAEVRHALKMAIVGP